MFEKVTLVLALCVALVSSYTLAQGNKPVIGVGSIESSFSDYDERNIQTAIETALSKTGKFTLIERGRLDELLEEQNLSIQGLVDGGSTSLGGFGGVDYLYTAELHNLGWRQRTELSCLVRG